MILRLCFIAALSSLSLPDLAQAQTPADQAVYELITEAWDYRMVQDPLWATRTGDHRFNDRLPVVSVERAIQSTTRDREYLARSEAISINSVSNKAKLDKVLFERSLKQGLEAFEFKPYLIPITNRYGFHISFPETRRTSPLKTKKDYENYIARLAGFKTYALQHIAIMRIGIEEGYTLPSVVLQRYADPIKTHIVEDFEKSLFYDPLRELSADVPVSEHETQRLAARQAIEESVVPGYEAFLEFMRDEYVPAARGSVGASALPNGRDYYRYCV